MIRYFAQALLLVSLVVTPASESHAETETPEARAGALVEQGLVHARKGEFSKAAELFEQAVKIYPDPSILHSLARAREEMGNHALAHETFRKALEMDPEYIYAGDARQRMEFLERLLASSHARLRVTSTPNGVDVTLTTESKGGSVRMITPFTHWTPAGNVTLAGRKNGFQDNSIVLTLEAGVEQTAELVLRPVARKGFLAIISSISGAKIYVDGEFRGVAPIEPFATEAGPHAIQVEAEGEETLQLDAMVEPDKETRVMARFGVEAKPAPGTAGEKTTLGSVLIGAGATSAVGAFVMHLAAFDAAADANAKYAEVENYNADGKGLSDEARDASAAARAFDDDAKNNQLVAFVGYGLAATLVGVGTWILLDDDSGSEPRTGDPETRWSPVLQPVTGGVFAGAQVRF